MDIETQFNDLGVDAIVGIELMNLLGLNQYDLMDTGRFLRFQDVIQHFKDNPDRSFVINRITIGKNVDRLDHVWGYAEMQRQKAIQEVETLKLSQQLYSLDQESPDFAINYNDLKSQVDSSMIKSVQLDDQLGRYER